MACGVSDTLLSRQFVAANCGLSRGLSDNLGDSNRNSGVE
jgi:hypothetical protein